MRDDKAMSNYFIAIDVISNIGSDFKVKQISGDCEKKLKEDI